MPGGRHTKRRKTLKRFGPRGRQVRVLEDGDRFVVQWYDRGRRRVKSWPKTRENKRMAIAWAEEFAIEQTIPKAVAHRHTIRALWKLYQVHVFPTLRPTSRTSYTARWQQWELFFGKDFIAEDVTVLNVDEFRLAQTRAPNQVRHIVSMAKIVYRWVG